VATRVLPFTVTIPAGTQKTAPVTIPLALDNWELESLDLEVPPGPSGLMGFQVYNNGVAWVPYGGGNWLVWDDVRERYSLTDQPNASGWAVVGYNTGVFDHAVILRFHVNPPTPPTVAGSSTPLVIVTTPDTSVVPVIL
jgi:hypothetical protein